MKLLLVKTLLEEFATDRAKETAKAQTQLQSAPAVGIVVSAVFEKSRILAWRLILSVKRV